jgi:hypothetical protein
MDELRAYLGDKFDPALIYGSDAVLAEDRQRHKSVTDWFQRSDYLLYHHTFVHHSGLDDRFIDIVAETVPRCTALDYRCIIGVAGFRLLAMGYEVAFAGLKGKALDYVRWRIRQRGFDYQVYEEGKAIPRFPLVVAYHVVETLTGGERTAFIKKLAELGETVAFNAPAAGAVPVGSVLRDDELEGIPGVSLLRWEPYNVNWRAVLFTTTEPTGPPLEKQPVTEPEETGEGEETDA